ncbi:E3 ubiquitin-protein ligase XIAP isoform X19 [Nymphalis io]|uniref:E3 ubiquitin-protein ligase XIAP isoform X2 n=1 Tax=Inachis io TaxID=171585 RepID=UPI002168D4A9|nr:E3 ubiquitin-protein ligase XIAP isoform X2 [Nymphalis io]XP_050348379.1 E3 ubiquitin-protein ligase XIAP isoform X3 [Nymphalis io]XP_050348380.1 E3 ubiquitin-protein ligase XIAP isoform X4 [Nymphalis io]XP_050348381.1 E3 ubiquitin-protein ligase XIAP isoform X5 [Nymphalis io]XP_050348382.1 E3 ubiquitin-protein ligase XIAP isoform X6 [Nymphalis io]XP_050348383.1 E3 ubiquitin-protein ligase XIAP isoform X7 [Nymphalis io]XP_050348385.1 E3 ubiquitin-protein ligase XIAP isoform X8 [Nymphalis i
MNQESNRLNTFTNWPTSAPVDPIRIAKAGFFYTGQGTEVECFSCGGKISEWNYGDQVMWRHRVMDPNCAFVLNPVSSGNVPLVVGRECNSIQSAEQRNTSQNSQQETDPPAETQRVTEEDEMYKSDALRLLSFVNWDDSSVAREELVNAGFYHAGAGRIRCAWCGGELAPFRNLGSLGTPLDVHRMYFPRCEHAATLEEERRNSEFSPPISPPSYTPPLTSPSTTRPQSSGAVQNARVVEAGAEWRSLGVVGGGARHPSRAALAARLATFERWPADRAQAPRTLADAGFFYTGIDDQVRCFYCDGGLGKWEAGDAPWSEHAHWFPHCGYVRLVRGQDFVDACRARAVPRSFSADGGLTSRNRNPSVNFPVSGSQIEECMESNAAVAALGAGLDAARVRRAIVRRLRTTGLPFSSSEALIDAVLDEQLNEEAWSVSPHSQRLARDILAETLRDFAPRSGIIPSTTDEERPDSQASQSDSPVRSPTPSNLSIPSNNPSDNSRTENLTSESSNNNHERNASPVSNPKQLTLEEENRQLREARMCKVCMDNEVSVVFLPCGHLVSCAGLAV